MEWGNSDEYVSWFNHWIKAGNTKGLFKFGQTKDAWFGISRNFRKIDFFPMQNKNISNLFECFKGKNTLKSLFGYFDILNDYIRIT